MKTIEITSRAGSAIVTVEEPIEHLQEVWLRGEFFEQRLLEYIYWHYKGGIFVDVGSALGNHSLFFAKFCEPKLVVSIEPVWRTRGRQKDIYRLNNIQDKIIILGCALSDVPGIGTMEPFANRNLGQFRLVAGDDVDVVTLDEIARDFDKERITLIKIDTEGHELKILRGAKQMLTERKPALFLEIRSRSMHQAITEYLASFGYQQVGSVFQDATVFEFTVQ